jgi:hypothetical protein
MTTTEKLERLKNRSSAFELMAVNDEMLKVLVGYTPQRSKIGMLKMIQKNGENWAPRLTGIEINFIKNGNKGPTARMGQFTVFFTGRTQREALLEGELPWFEDILPIIREI